MNLKVYYLSSCDTCKRILKSLDLPENTILQDIKKQHLSADELTVLRTFVDSYKDLLNTRAQKLRSGNYKLDKMTDAEIAELILSHYSFLKRPVFLFDDNAFIGNGKSNLAQLSDFLS